MDKFILNGVKDKLHYLEFGKGKPVILIPSLWVTSKTYFVLGREIGKYYHVYIPDLYCGKSKFENNAIKIEDYIQLLAEFIRKLNIKKYYLVGISLSGIIIAKFLLKYKRLPIKSFLISTTVLPLKLKNQRLFLFRGYIMILVHNLSSFSGLKTNWLWISDGLENAWRHFRQALIQGLIASSVKIENIKRLPVPVKLIFALRDEFIPREAVGRLAKVKNLDLETIDGYHGWFFRREKELALKIRKFFS